MRVGLRGRLLGLLLAFGVLPLAAAVIGGYAVSRRIVTDQADSALADVVLQQALHVAAELERERLLLRTIAGRLPAPSELQGAPAGRLERMLVQGLPQGGVFDGLRLVAASGRVLASVGLSNTSPDWPPAETDWRVQRVVVHRHGASVAAYLLAVPVDAGADADWLEGHVRAQDFARIFDLPEHVLGGAEIAIRKGDNVIVAVGHRHAAGELLDAFRSFPNDSVHVAKGRIGGESAVLGSALVPGSDWSVVVGLPVDIALAPLARLRDAALVGVLLLVALIVLTGAAVSRSLTGTLRQLAGALRRLGESGESAMVPAGRTDEIGQLVEAFNHMALDLRQSRNEIERLHAADLERAQQLATVGELASGVAHEIRNPLTGVHGALELALRRLPEDEASRPLLEEAQKQLARMETAITQLLRYARPPELRAVAVDASEIADRAVRLVEPQATRAAVHVMLGRSAIAARVEVDPELMVQVLVNLLLNGLEVTPAEGMLTVWLTRRAPQVWIGVTDAGPGVPMELREQIFRPFFTTKARGTGLGLSLSKQIVIRHGGTLHVEDTPGGGATFIVCLPLAAEAG